jgi:hypothetical protein
MQRLNGARKIYLLDILYRICMFLVEVATHRLLQLNRLPLPEQRIEF